MLNSITGGKSRTQFNDWSKTAFTLGTDSLSCFSKVLRDKATC